MKRVRLQNFGDETLEIYGGDIRNVIYSKDQAKDMLEQLSHICEGLDDFIKETKLRQLFKNRADAYLNTIDESVEQGMSEDCFIKLVCELKNVNKL